MSRARDSMANLPIRDVATSCYEIFSNFDKNPGRNRLSLRTMSVACALVLLSGMSGEPLNDILGFARNCVNDAEGIRPEFEAAKTYIKKEMS